MVFKYTVDWQPVGVYLTWEHRKVQRREDNQGHLKGRQKGYRRST